MYDKIMKKIYNNQYKSFKQAIDEINLYFRMGLLSKKEFIDCKDYAIFKKSDLNKKKYNNSYIVLY